MGCSITTHVLDTARGRPASSVHVVLEHESGAQGWIVVGRARTDADGRVKRDLAPAQGVPAGTYRLTFDTLAWFRAQDIDAFYPEVRITFIVQGDNAHFHVPLLLGPWSFSTYRGS